MPNLMLFSQNAIFTVCIMPLYYVHIHALLQHFFSFCTQFQHVHHLTLLVMGLSNVHWDMMVNLMLENHVSSHVMMSMSYMVVTVEHAKMTRPGVELQLHVQEVRFMCFKLNYLLIQCQ